MCYHCGKTFKHKHTLLIHEGIHTGDKCELCGLVGGIRRRMPKEQLLTLITYYQLNPYPKQEELESIATKIQQPVKVVKCWFKNSRTRKRKVGKQPPQLSFPNYHTVFQNFLNNFQQDLIPRLSRPSNGHHLTQMHLPSPVSDPSKSPDSTKTDTEIFLKKNNQSNNCTLLPLLVYTEIEINCRGSHLHVVFHIYTD